MTHPLLQFCSTKKQNDAVRLVLEDGLSQNEAAVVMNMTRSSLKEHLRAVRNKAKRQGYSPENDWLHPVPDGHKIKGVSTFYDEDGNPVRQWVKSQTDEQRQFEILIERLEAEQEGLPRF